MDSGGIYRRTVVPAGKTDTCQLSVKGVSTHGEVRGGCGRGEMGPSCCPLHLFWFSLSFSDEDLWEAVLDVECSLAC